MLTVAVFGATLPTAAIAQAQEPRAANEPLPLSTTAQLTHVVDAFDEDDDFDLTLSLGYDYSTRSAAILRETHINQPGLTTGGYLSDDLNVATYEETRSRLLTKAEVGVFRDIALILRMPIVLSHDQKLSTLDGSGAVNGLNTQGLLGESLFSVPFNSPTRSGIEYLAVGLDFGILNQTRDATKPTWVFGFEGRFNVSEPMHACNEAPAAGQVKCAYPSDVNRDGRSTLTAPLNNVSSELDLEGNFSGSRKAGVSRGTTGLAAHTYVSRRVKYIEPYGGFSILVEPGQSESSDFRDTNVQGSLVNNPPLRGSMTAGIEVTPWEVREKFQRILLDFRFKGTYVSEGRDYSELFDALGSSDAASLRTPQFAEFVADPNDANQSVVNTNSQRIYTTGLTDVQQHGDYELSAQLTWRAGEFIQFNLGASYRIIQGHMITFDQPCNPDFKGDLSRAGTCRAEVPQGSGNYRANGIPNPNYRRVVNAPGRRFRVGTSTGLNTWVTASVMF